MTAVRNAFKKVSLHTAGYWGISAKPSPAMSPNEHLVRQNFWFAKAQLQSGPAVVIRRRRGFFAPSMTHRNRNRDEDLEATLTRFLHANRSRVARKRFTQ
jgi:hypothetical protein